MPDAPAPQAAPGQRACIAWNAAYGEAFAIMARDEWAASDEAGKAAWDAAAQAVLDAAFPGLKRERDMAREDAARLRAALERLADAAARVYNSQLSRDGLRKECQRARAALDGGGRGV